MQRVVTAGERTRMASGPFLPQKNSGTSTLTLRTHPESTWLHEYRCAILLGLSARRARVRRTQLRWHSPPSLRGRAREDRVQVGRGDAPRDGTRPGGDRVIFLQSMTWRLESSTYHPDRTTRTSGSHLPPGGCSNSDPPCHRWTLPRPSGSCRSVLTNWSK